MGGFLPARTTAPDVVMELDMQAIILFLCVSSAVVGFAVGKTSRRRSLQQKRAHVEDRVHFFKFTQLVLDLMPILLRQYFRERWQARYGRSWRDTSDDGELFHHGSFQQRATCNVRIEAGSRVVVAEHVAGGCDVRCLKQLLQLPDGSPGLSVGDTVLIGEVLHKVQTVRKDRIHLYKPCMSTGTRELRIQEIKGENNMDSRMQRFFTPKVMMGDTRDWDMSLLCFALLYSSHALIPIGDDARQLVEGLRDLRNNKLAHISACSMQREELWEAVRKMDDFIEYCLPSEWELWLTTSREILDQAPMDFEDGHTPNMRRQNSNLDKPSSSSDQVVISIDEYSDIMDREEEAP